MKFIRCVVCRQTLPTLKTLRSHYVAAHSKLQLVRALINNTIYKNHVKRKHKNVESLFENVRPQYLKSEILYLEDGFQNSNDLDDSSSKILISQSKIESKSETEESDWEESFEESDDSKNDVKKVLVKIEENMKRRKENLLRLRNFRFDKSLRKRRSSMALDDQTGLFYICHCSHDVKSNVVVDCFQKNDLQNFISDTDSCSDDMENSFCMSVGNLKCYCDICGNGYTSKTKLIKHFEVHNTSCSICKKRFSNNFGYKQHMKKHLLKVFLCHLCSAEFVVKNMLMDHLDAHIENDVFENVFSLEEDYNLKSGTSYFRSTNNNVYFG